MKKTDLNQAEKKEVHKNSSVKKKTTSKPKLKVGRKSKYETHVKPKLALITVWSRNGCIEEQIWKKLGVGKDSFYLYKREHQELFDALKLGKEDADDMVEAALYKRAMGYEYEEAEESESYNPETGQTTKTRTITKHLVADTTAQIFWLKNRRKDKWRNNEKQEITISTDAVTAHNDLLLTLKTRAMSKEINDIVEQENE